MENNLFMRMSNGIKRITRMINDNMKNWPLNKDKQPKNFFQRILSEWLLDSGNAKSGQYFFFLIIMVIVSIIIYKEYGNQIADTLSLSWKKFFAGF